jgi:hypothetical protein
VAVVVASLGAHALLLTLWMTTRPNPIFVEPPAIQVELLRPVLRERPRPTPTPQPRKTLSVPQPTLTAPPILSQPAIPSAPALPTAPRPLDPRQMTDQELVERAGPRPDIGKLHGELAKRPLYSSRLPPGGEDCKPATEHSDRIAPPCPAWGAGPPLPLDRLPNRPALAAEAARKDALKSYKDHHGSTGVASPDDYPGLSCTLLHRC